MKCAQFGPFSIAAAALIGLAPCAAAATPAEKPVAAKPVANAAKPVAKPAAKKAADTAPAKPIQSAATKPAVPMPRAKPGTAAASPALASTVRRVPAAFVTASAGDLSFALPQSESPPTALAYAPTATPAPSDVDAVREALALVRKGRTSEATQRAQNIRDSAGQKLVEWVLLRSDDTEATFARYAAFIRANPGWPSIGMLRRRAEAQLWQEKRDPATVLAFFAGTKPQSAKGRLAVARALLAQGDRASAQAFLREAWRQDSMSAELEAQVIESFGELLTRGDHKARMHYRLYAEDTDDGMRAAQRLGEADLAIAKAWVAVTGKGANAGALLDAVPNEARGDAAYLFARIKWLRRNDRAAEAGQLMLSAPNDPAIICDTNEWWVERRLIARKLLDLDNPQAAYRVVRDAAVPAKENYRVEHHFTAGWIALRFLGEAGLAQRHFAQILPGATNPISLARGHYWQGRAAEAAGSSGEARSHYEAAARFSTAYYGQLARTKLGRTELTLRHPPAPSDAQRASLRNMDIVRAAEMLYALGERDLVIPFVADLADKATEIGALVLLGEIAAKNGDARAMLLLGKTALGRGFAFDHYAFPNIGVPKFAAIGPEIDRSAVFAIARQESAFNPKVVSSASAMGLMQVMPGTGKLIAKKFGVAWNQNRMLSDPAYNAQMGAAELGDLVRDYDGNYMLAFAAYNAGRGRVREWVGRFGDPRDPQVDPVDWAERIPFSETRNYVQRVMENMQIYRARFGTGARLTIEADLRGARAN